MNTSFNLHEYLTSAGLPVRQVTLSEKFPGRMVIRAYRAGPPEGFMFYTVERQQGETDEVFAIRVHDEVKAALAREVLA